MMVLLMRVLAGVPGVLFIITGGRWLFDSTGFAQSRGLVPAEGMELGTQAGDAASYFVALGTIMLIAAITRKRIWFYTPAILLSAVVVFRFLGWMLHGAPLVLERMALEATFATIMIVAAYIAGED